MTDEIGARSGLIERDRREGIDDDELTTITHVSLNGVMQGLGGPDEDRRGGPWSAGFLDKQFVDEIILLIYPVVLGQGTRLLPETGPDMALELADSQTTPSGITIQVYRPTGRPQYATATADQGT